MNPLQIPTGVGHASFGENHFRGYRVGAELAGRETQTGLIALSIGARRLSDAERAVLDDIAVVMTVADPRIWPLKLTRVVSAYGSTLPAMAAANLCIERAFIGHWTSGTAAQTLVELHESLGDAVEDRNQVRRRALELLAQRRRWMGFGVPFRQQDERVASLRLCLEKRGRTHMTYWRLLETVAAVLYDHKQLRPNIGIAVGAACLDLGYSPREVSLLSVALGQTDYLANAVEGAAQAPEMLRELPAQILRYQGPARRRSPRATAP